MVGARHFDSLTPCNAKPAPDVAVLRAIAPGFDRPAFHKTFNAAVVRFFRKTLR